MTPGIVTGRATQRTRRRRQHRRWFAHSSGRFDRPVTAWSDGLTRLTRRASVITGTEAAGRKPWLFNDTFEPLGWSWAHLVWDTAAEAECFAAWDERQWTRGQRPYAYKLSDMTWVRSPEYGGKPAAKVHALVVHLQKRQNWRKAAYEVALVVVHMPLDNTSRRAAAWEDCCKGLVELKAKVRRDLPRAKVIVVGDINKNLREPGEADEIHDHLEKPLDMMNSWRGWVSQTKGGTRGRDLIDMAFAAVGFITDCQLLPDTDDSDHRPFRFRIRRR